MSRTLCLTPTPISSDIPNKVFVDQALAEMHTENSVELSDSEENVCSGGTTGGVIMQKICDLWNLSSAWHFPEDPKKKNKTSKTSHVADAF